MKTTNHPLDTVVTDVATLVSKQKEKIEKTHEQLLKTAEKLGEKDGTIGLPIEGDTQASPNEDLLKNEYQRLLAECWKKGKPYLDGPHVAYKTFDDKVKDLEANGNAVLDNELNMIEERRNDEETQIHKEFSTREGELESRGKVLERDFVTVKQELSNIQDRVGRSSPVIHFKSGFLYFLLLIGIGICEVPLNLQIFQKFGEAFFITVIMASSLAIAIPVLAHFTGVFIKQRKEKKEYSWFAVMCVAIFFIFNFGVSIFRAYVLAEHMGESANDLNIVIFTCLNLILFIIGVLAAYFRHDESYELEYSYAKFQKVKKGYDKEKSELKGKMNALSNEKNGQLKKVHDVYMEEKRNLFNTKNTFVSKRNEYIQIYDELLNSFQALEAYLDASYRIAVNKYRSANLTNRKDHLSPKAWRKGIGSLKLKFAGIAELDPN